MIQLRAASQRSARSEVSSSPQDRRPMDPVRRRGFFQGTLRSA